MQNYVQQSSANLASSAGLDESVLSSWLANPVYAAGMSLRPLRNLLASADLQWPASGILPCYLSWITHGSFLLHCRETQTLNVADCNENHVVPPKTACENVGAGGVARRSRHASEVDSRAPQDSLPHCRHRGHRGTSYLGNMHCFPRHRQPQRSLRRPATYPIARHVCPMAHPAPSRRTRGKPRVACREAPACWPP